jgi:hypothetical protein
VREESRVHRVAWDVERFRPLSARTSDVETIGTVAVARGVRQGHSWSPIEVWASHEPEFDGTDLPDSPLLLPGIVVVGSQAAPTLASTSTSELELLPLKGALRLTIVNVTSFVDCLDEGASTIARFQSGRPRRVVEPRWLKGSEHLSLFRIPQMPYEVYIGSEAPEIDIVSGLSGLNLEGATTVP